MNVLLLCAIEIIFCCWDGLFTIILIHLHEEIYLIYEVLIDHVSAVNQQTTHSLHLNMTTVGGVLDW